MKIPNPVVKKFFEDVRDYGLDVAMLETDIDVLLKVDPILGSFVLELLSIQNAIDDHFLDAYGLDTGEQVEPTYESDDDDNEGEEWKQK